MFTKGSQVKMILWKIMDSNILTLWPNPRFEADAQKRRAA